MIEDDPFGCLARAQSDQVGVRRFEPGRLEPGLVLFHSVVGNKAVVIDERGEVIEEFSATPLGYDLYRPVRPGNRGTIFAILTSQKNRDNRVIAEINRNGEIIWATKPRWFTHDFHILRDRHVLSVVRENRHIGGRRFSDTSIVELNARGELIWSWSLWDHLDELKDGPATRRRITEDHINNPFHINSVQFQDSEFTRKMFAEPVVVVSARNVNSVFIVGRQSNKILYEIYGECLGQHHARILPDKYPGRGNVIIFDNGVSFYGPKESTNRSRIIEYSIRNNRVEWHYEADDFFSPIVGAQQRFVGGNTLITEGYYGRIFEIGYDGEIVWDYVYPGLNEVGSTNKKLYEAGLRQIYRAYKVPRDWLE
jgi:hypothetical protein